MRSLSKLLRIIPLICLAAFIAAGCAHRGSNLSPDYILDYAGEHGAVTFDSYNDFLNRIKDVQGSFAFRTSVKEISSSAARDVLGLNRFIDSDDSSAEDLTVYIKSDNQQIKTMAFALSYKSGQIAKAAYRKYASGLKSKYKDDSEIKAGTWKKEYIVTTIVLEDNASISSVGVFLNDRYVMIMMGMDHSDLGASFNGICDDLGLPDIYYN